MNKSFGFIALLLCSFPLIAAHPGPGRGFNDFQWGDPPPFHMDRVDRRDDMDVYFLPGDTDRIAGVRRATIRYLFRDGRLCRVEVGWRKWLNGREYQTLVASLTRDWGAPDESTGRALILWRSPEGETEARLEAVDRAATPWVDYDASMIIQAAKCQ
jgi:hypothetical protein